MKVCCVQCTIRPGASRGPQQGLSSTHSPSLRDRHEGRILQCGYTAARSGGSLFNIDVWLKKAIENDICPGPRMAASGREIRGVGGLMDWNPDFRKIGMEGLVLLVNGPNEARAAVRKLVKDGVEWVKTQGNRI